MNTTDSDKGLETSGDVVSDECQNKEALEASSSKLHFPEQPIKTNEASVQQHEQASPNNENVTSETTGSTTCSGSKIITESAETPTTETTIAIPQQPTPPAEVKEVINDKKKEDDKLGIYKALAIKLKKELVKSRDELQKLREDSSKECIALNQRVKTLEDELETLQQTSATAIVTLESKVKSLKEQLDNSEQDLQNLQNDFENYKVRASKIMQQNTSSHTASNKTFEEDRYKQLKELSDEHLKRISTLESQLSASINRNLELEKETKLLQEELEAMNEKLGTMRVLDDKCESLSHENENLKLALKQFRTKLKEPSSTSCNSKHCDEYSNSLRDTGVSVNAEISKKNYDNAPTQSTATNTIATDQASNRPVDAHDHQDDNVIRVSPSASLKDESQTNSSSSFDGSTSGYVHIKPTTFEIISRSSVLEDAQNQIDNLTKAYLDSENTNSLLSDQVRALKEEIRRLQRGTERMDLAENLEYLKNVVFKFISLESGQTEQKQRLIPVLSTVLKLSPEETAKLNSLAIADKPSMASSFFKL